jgi:hypothetical protein
MPYLLLRILHHMLIRIRGSMGPGIDNQGGGSRSRSGNCGLGLIGIGGTFDRAERPLAGHVLADLLLLDQDTVRI